MHEKGRGAGAGQGGGDLVADMTGLAHADHDHAPAAVQDHLAGAHEVGVDAAQQAFHGLGFEADGALRGLDQVAGLAHEIFAVLGIKGREYTDKGGRPHLALGTLGASCDQLL
jgi:hypothetical protein